jgi:two-component system sensor histidine kinase/response regulator
MTEAACAMNATIPEEILERSAHQPVEILLVDDQPENLLSASAVLEPLGEAIFKAESGKEALRYVLDHDFAVIVLDVMMPEMDGFETAAFIRQRERSRHTPIIFLTALGRSEEHMRISYDLGAVDYLTKPFVPEVLSAKVKVFVELHRKTLLLHQQSQLLESRNAELQQAISRSRRAEQEITELNRSLEQQISRLNEVNQELETFSYSVSHDLRGPLNRMAGFSKALLELQGGQLDGQSKVYLERIDASARRASDLVEDLLQFSRLARVEFQETNVDISALAREIAGDLALREPERPVEFVIPNGITARADGTLVRAALLNLFENAWKFTRRRNPARIEFGTEETPAGRAFFVRDNGAGFDMADYGRLFQPFQRLHRPADFEGTGIGLATVDRIVRRHGGTVWAHGEVDRGATFYFTIRGDCTV